MKPQSEAFLENAQELLEQSEKMLTVDLCEAAGRTAYLAGFHAAQALIFETHDRVFKTHSGVQGEFARLAKQDPGVDLELRSFLGQAYQLKSVADYETGPDSHVSIDVARDALRVARRFVACVTQMTLATVSR